MNYKKINLLIEERILEIKLIDELLKKETIDILQILKLALSRKAFAEDLAELYKMKEISK